MLADARETLPEWEAEPRTRAVRMQQRRVRPFGRAAPAQAADGEPPTMCRAGPRSKRCRAGNIPSRATASYQ